MGRRKRALAPVASTTVGGTPAIVLTTAPAVILRIALLAASAIHSTPAASEKTPRGSEKRAAAPTPSCQPAWELEPARVVTVPPGLIMRTDWPSVPDTTYRLPAPSDATSFGKANRAAAPTPSTLVQLWAVPTKSE